MFSGCFVYTVDDKNRISIPAQFRKELPDGFVITKGPDGCLWVLPPDRWQIMLDRASASPAIQRFFLASACHCKPCAKGRYLLPDNLRRHADIKPGDEVAIVGLLDRMEIWSARRWDTVCSQLTSDRIRQELPEFFEMR